MLTAPLTGASCRVQVLGVCRDAKPGLQVQRARFSALVQSELQRALNNLVQPNQHEAWAVDARQEIDLRIGASFTRFQTLLLQVGDYLFDLDS